MGHGKDVLADLYALSPHLYEELFADVDPADPTSLARFYEACRAIVACQADVRRRLPGLGMTLPELVELRQRAWEAEEEASHHWESGDFHSDRPRSPKMEQAIRLLNVRGLPGDRISCALGVHPAWVEATLAGFELSEVERAVMARHRAGATLATIVAETNIPRTTAADIIRRLGDEPRTNSQASVAQRRARARRLRAAGRSIADIAGELGVPEHTLKNDLRPKLRASGQSHGDTWPKGSGRRPGQ